MSHIVIAPWTIGLDIFLLLQPPCIRTSGASWCPHRNPWSTWTKRSMTLTYNPSHILGCYKLSFAMYHRTDHHHVSLPSLHRAHVGSRHHHTPHCICSNHSKWPICNPLG